MKHRALLVGGLALALAAAAMALADDRSPEADDPHHTDGDQKGCARCHLDQVPPSHTQEFFTNRHGEAALASRASCTGCHERSECDSCHEQKRPLWHESGMAWPQLSAANRRAHAELGRQRRQDCMACHEHRFHEQCSECHQRTEMP